MHSHTVIILIFLRARFLFLIEAVRTAITTHVVARIIFVEPLRRGSGVFTNRTCGEMIIKPAGIGILKSGRVAFQIRRVDGDVDVLRRGVGVG